MEIKVAAGRPGAGMQETGIRIVDQFVYRKK